MSLPGIQLNLLPDGISPAAADLLVGWQSARLKTVSYTLTELAAWFGPRLALAASQSAYTDTRGLGAANLQAAVDALVLRDLTDEAALSAFEASAEILARKNAANGYAGLDSSGKIPRALIPDSALGNLQYQGTWDAAANTPGLVSGNGTKGQYYVVSVAGSTLIDGFSDWQLRDWIVFDGTVWDHVAGGSAITGINGHTGPVVTLTSSDLGYADSYGLGASNAQTALDKLAAAASAHAARLGALEASRTTDEANILALQNGVGSAGTALSTLESTVAGQATSIASLNATASSLSSGVSSLAAGLSATNGAASTLTAGYTALAAAAELSARKGAASGYAALDASGFVPLSQINPALLGGTNFIGVWDSSTNTPAIASGVGSAGHFYRVSVASTGATTLDGNATWTVGDEVFFNGVLAVWQRVQVGASVAFVNGQSGVSVEITAAEIPYADSHAVGATTAQGVADYLAAAKLSHDATLATLNTSAASAASGLTALSSALSTLNAAAEKIAAKGAANGYAPLDSTGKVPVANLPASVVGALAYQGVWNAATNSPGLASGVGYKGWYYVVSVAGATAIDGISLWAVGDWAVYNGTTWNHIAGSDATILTVNGLYPTAGNVAVSAAAVPYADTHAIGATTAQAAVDALWALGEKVSRKGAASGYCGLDSSGYVPLANLPPALVGAMQYQGAWNASTNSPALASSVGTKGYMYKVSVAGTTSLNGVAVWNVGDFAIFDGAAWDRFDGADLTASMTTYADTHAMGVGTVQGAVDALWTLGEKVGNKGSANGYAGLDSTGKVPIGQIPTTISTAGNNTSYTDTYGIGAATVQSALDSLAQYGVWASVAGSLPLLTTTAIASTAGSATLLKSGNTVTVSDGTTLATYTAANGDTLAALMTAINGASGLKIAAGLDPGGRLRLTAQRGVSITVGGVVTAPATLASVLGLSAGTTASAAYQGQASSVRVDDNYGVGATTVQAALDYILAQLSVLTHLTTTSAGGLTTTSS